MPVQSSLDDVVLTSAFTGMPARWLRGSIAAAGLDPATLPASISADGAAALYGSGQNGQRAARWADIWSAGHSVSGVADVPTVAGIVARLRQQYDAARQAATAL